MIAQPDFEIPSLYLLAASKDRKKPVKFEEKFHKTRSHMEFVEKFGSTGIKLGERSHLPARLVTREDMKRIRKEKEEEMKKHKNADL